MGGCHRPWGGHTDRISNVCSIHGDVHLASRYHAIGVKFVEFVELYETLIEVGRQYDLSCPIK